MLWFNTISMCGIAPSFGAGLDTYGIHPTEYKTPKKRNKLKKKT